MTNGRKGGQPGNSNAAKGRRLSSRLAKRLEERQKIDDLADVLIAKALDGDMQAIKEIFDRVDGKAIQQIDATVREITDAAELTDSELLNIAAASRARAAEQAGSEKESDSLH